MARLYSGGNESQNLATHSGSAGGKTDIETKTVVGGETKPFEKEVSVPSKRTKKRHTIEFTVPNIMLRHDLPDHELDILASNDTDRGWMHMFLGVFVGGISFLIENIYSAYFSTTPEHLSLLDTIQIVIMCVCLALAIQIGVKTRNNKNKAQALLAEIRSRKRKKVYVDE